MPAHVHSNCQSDAPSARSLHRRCYAEPLRKLHFCHPCTRARLAGKFFGPLTSLQLLSRLRGRILLLESSQHGAVDYGHQFALTQRPLLVSRQQDRAALGCLATPTEQRLELRHRVPEAIVLVLFTGLA